MSNFAYLTGCSRLECLKPGFEGIEPGTLLPLRVWKEEVIREGTRMASDGSTRKLTSKRREMLIELTAPDGTRHRFHTDPAGIEEALARPTLNPASRFARPAAPIKHHAIDTFVEFFHVPLPHGVQPLPNPSDHALLDLLEAITAAYHRKYES